MNPNRFYIYIHTVKEEFEIDGKVYPVGAVVYVGSGTHARLKCKKGRSKKHLSVFDKLDKVVIHDGLVEEDKIYFEQKYTDEYDKFGYLLNTHKKIPKVLDIDLELIKEYLEVDVNSPSGLVWKKPFHPNRTDLIGKPAGSMGIYGYWVVMFNYKGYRAHRIVWMLVNGKEIPKNMVINHIDLNRSNNHPDNLECVSISVNNRNKGLNSRNNSGVNGLLWNEEKRHWHVTIAANGVRAQKRFGVKDLMKSGLSFEEAKDIAKNLALNFLEEQKLLIGY